MRTCDGFYFPISAATSRAYFHKDAGTCRSRCGTATKLYYLPRRSSDMKRARDLEGRSYAELENAFKYRKKLVDGCACRAMPWTSSERARHRRYEYIEAVQKSYALAEARAKKRREEAAILAQKQREEAQAARRALIAQANENGENTGVVQTTNLLLKNSSGFQYRWITVSKLYAAPTTGNARHPNATMNIASVDVQFPQDPQSAQGTTTNRPASFTYEDFDKNRRTRRSKSSTSRHRSKAAAGKKNRRKKKKTGAVFSGLFGQQKSKYSWPGD